ncbi:hypothetical protein TEA_025324 [Camellia sinensis var. sinensis]|uniref:Uncharacterized protein n=1 Tax=Camellia sinensis var. sinensis TaxID=542762 RepID=A0A4S4D0K3_CAMSN|nr:hypothetical protein TEA_025324 [Camellia sinensis var. sinensis]
MAQFTVQGRLKPLFNGDGMLIGFEPKEPRHHHRHKLLSGSDPFPLRFHKRKLGLRGSSSTRLSASSSSPASKSYHFNSEASLSVGNDGIYDDSEGTAEFERDELSCFRGLVLDISYRPVNVVCWKRAICLEFMEKADVLEYYDQTVNSPSGSFYIPAVLREIMQTIMDQATRNEQRLEAIAADNEHLRKELALKVAKSQQARVSCPGSIAREADG